MFEFKKLCDAYESMSAVEKYHLLGDRSTGILKRLDDIAIPGVDAVRSLAAFIVGSAVLDGRVNERDYVVIYPALVRVFGEDFDFSGIKSSFSNPRTNRQMIMKYTEDVRFALEFLDDEAKDDIVKICLCIAAIDGKVSLKEKLYIKRLCDM